jgi:hypothetical protein
VNVALGDALRETDGPRERPVAALEAVQPSEVRCARHARSRMPCPEHSTSGRILGGVEPNVEAGAALDRLQSGLFRSGGEQVELTVDDGGALRRCERAKIRECGLEATNDRRRASSRKSDFLGGE